MGVKPYPMSVALVAALAILLAPLSRVFAAHECGMPGVSSERQKNCAGCCKVMACCALSKQDEKPQPVQAPSSGRAEAGSLSLLAVAWKAPAFGAATPRPPRAFPPGTRDFLEPELHSLDRLCVRLI